MTKPGLFERFLERVAPSAPVAVRPRRSALARAFAAAQYNRLTADFTAAVATINSDLKMGGKRLRQRSRNLIQNDPYMKKFVRTLQKNVIGPAGIAYRPDVRNAQGDPDAAVNAELARGFKEWGKLANCTVTKRLSWRDAQNIALHSWIANGEYFFRKIAADNPFGFALQYIDPDQIDDEYNLAPTVNANEVIQGVEVDQWRAPVAYWFLTRHPAEYGYAIAKRVRVPASEIIHDFIAWEGDQVRGVPMPHAVILRLWQLGKYEEAELIASRIESAKMGFFIQENESGEPLDEEDEPEIEVAPGVFETLPKGIKDFKPFDPQHPQATFEPFTKAMLRGIASGLDLSYTTLSGDHNGVNFSSIRAFMLEDRESYRDLQAHMIEHLHEPVLSGWLPNAMLAGGVKLPGLAPEKYLAAKWQPRGWAWVDPVKDVQAAALALQNGLTDWSDEIAQSGRTREEVWDTLRKEQAEIKSQGPEVLVSGKLPGKDSAPGPEAVSEGDGSSSGGGNDGGAKN